ncbi:MAG: HAMP domain-containing histidine kinase [Bacteroidales bacterium]|nr:HAMP domain-containing histidine kinase [Bacteroidales bacterium]
MEISDKELIEELKKRFIEKEKSLQELKLLTQELQIVNKKLEESESLKSHFISNITNEITNPFASILGLSRSILSVKKEDWKKVISMVALIHSEAFTLDFQLKNIFVAAKIEAGEFIPEILNVDICILIKSLLDSFRVFAKKKRLDIHYNDSVCKKRKNSTFKTDPEKLKQILSNLLSNAIKFSLEDSPIVVETDIIGNELVITVQDYGIGISEENQKIIFDRFKRVDNGINSLNRGHGLGLSVNKALLDLLKGRIEINSKIGEGATFRIFIPESEEEVEGFSTDGNEFLFEGDENF